MKKLSLSLTTLLLLQPSFLHAMNPGDDPMDIVQSSARSLQPEQSATYEAAKQRYDEINQIISAIAANDQAVNYLIALQKEKEKLQKQHGFDAPQQPSVSNYGRF